MGFSKPNIDDVKVTTSLVFKGNIAPKGCIYYIASLIDKSNNMKYTLHQLMTRNGASVADELTFANQMREKLYSDVYSKKA